MKLKRILLLTIIIGLLLLVYSFKIIQLFSNPSASNKQKYNIILISIDTLRPDHTSLFGYERNTTPNLDKFAGNSIVFENAFSQASWTVPSHVSVFTSKYPSSHGVNERWDRISYNDITLPEVLKENGYKTAAFVGSTQDGGGDLQPFYGFSRGFDVYNMSGLYYNSTVPSAIDWLEENKDNRFFLFLHGYDVHDPYHKPEPFEDFFDPTYKGFIDKLYLFGCASMECDTHKIKKLNNGFVYVNDSQIIGFDEGDITNVTNVLPNNELNISNAIINQSEITNLTRRDIDHIIAHYDGNILWADFMLGKFFDELDKLGVYNNTIVIIFSDHGENLADHSNQKLFSHENLYDEITHVFLMIRYPNMGHKVIDGQAQLIDIMPTIMNFLNIERPKGIQGKGLVPLIRNNTDINQYVVSELERTIFERSIRNPEWRLINRVDIYGVTSVELYNLTNDRKEQTNVVDKFPNVTVELENKMKEILSH